MVSWKDDKSIITRDYIDLTDIYSLYSALHYSESERFDILPVPRQRRFLTR